MTDIEIKEENCFAHDIGLLIKTDDWEQLQQQILQDQKLRKLIEKVKDYALRNNFEELWEILK